MEVPSNLFFAYSKFAYTYFAFLDELFVLRFF